MSNLGRDGKREVVLTGRLRSALLRLNPDLPMEAIDGAVEEISRDRSALSLVEANREIDKLLQGGVNRRNNGFQFLRPFQRLVKLAFSVKRHGSVVEDMVSRFRENDKIVKIRLFFTKSRLFVTT